MRVANLYFLLCAILQLIPGLSPTRCAHPPAARPGRTRAPARLRRRRRRAGAGDCSWRPTGGPGVPAAARGRGRSRVSCRPCSRSRACMHACSCM
jgi:hypothetical protein